MATESEKTKEVIFREFAEKKRKVRKFGYVFLLSSAAFGVAYVFASDSPFRPWVLGVGMGVFLVIMVIWNLDWSCPACGKLFRKSGLRIRFCPHCGVQLVDNSVRYQPTEAKQTRAQQDSDGQA